MFKTPDNVISAVSDVLSLGFGLGLGYFSGKFIVNQIRPKNKVDESDLKDSTQMMSNAGTYIVGGVNNPISNEVKHSHNITLTSQILQNEKNFPKISPFENLKCSNDVSNFITFDRKSIVQVSQNSVLEQLINNFNKDPVNAFKPEYQDILSTDDDTVFQFFKNFAHKLSPNSVSDYLHSNKNLLVRQLDFFNFQKTPLHSIQYVFLEENYCFQKMVSKLIK